MARLSRYTRSLATPENPGCAHLSRKVTGTGRALPLCMATTHNSRIKVGAHVTFAASPDPRVRTRYRAVVLGAPLREPLLARVAYEDYPGQCTSVRWDRLRLEVK